MLFSRLSGWISRRDSWRADARLQLVGVVAEDDVLAGAAGVGQLHGHARRARRRSTPRCHCSRVGRLVLERVPEHARVGGLQLRGRARLHLHDRRERIVERPDRPEVGRIGREADVLRDRVRHLLADHVRRRRLLREVGDAEAGPQNRRLIAEQVVGQAETRREVAVLRLLVHRVAGAVLARVDQPHAGRVVVDDLVVLFGLGPEDLVAKAGVDREPRAAA